MPYIPESERPQIAVTIPPTLSTGQLNFLLSDIVDQWIGLVPDYDRLNSAIGVLECCMQEVYSRIVSPYERKKQALNGDVFMERE